MWKELWWGREHIQYKSHCGQRFGTFGVKAWSAVMTQCWRYHHTGLGYRNGINIEDTSDLPFDIQYSRSSTTQDINDSYLTNQHVGQATPSVFQLRTWICWLVNGHDVSLQALHFTVTTNLCSIPVSLPVCSPGRRPNACFSLIGTLLHPMVGKCMTATL